MGKTTGVRPPLRRLRRHPHRRGKAMERCLSWERAARPPLRHGLRRATSPQGEAFGVRRLPLRGAVGVSRLRGVWEVSKKKEPLCHRREAPFYMTYKIESSKVSGNTSHIGFRRRRAIKTVCLLPLCRRILQTARTMSAWSTIYWFRFRRQSGVYCRCNIVSWSHRSAMEK